MKDFKEKMLHLGVHLYDHKVLAALTVESLFAWCLVIYNQNFGTIMTTHYENLLIGGIFQNVIAGFWIIFAKFLDENKEEDQ